MANTGFAGPILVALARVECQRLSRHMPWEKWLFTLTRRCLQRRQPVRDFVYPSRKRAIDWYSVG